MLHFHKLTEFKTGEKVLDRKGGKALGFYGLTMFTVIVGSLFHKIVFSVLRGVSKGLFTGSNAEQMPWKCTVLFRHESRGIT